MTALSMLLLSPTLSAASRVQAVEVVSGLAFPWSLVFLPDGEMLVSERSGSLRRIVDGQLLPRPVRGVPKVAAGGQGGLLGLALHPQFAENHWLYFAYAAAGEGGYSTHVGRGKYRDGVLSEVQTIFRATPKVNTRHHYGGHLIFDRQGYLFLTLGDKGRRELAQDLRNHAGSVIRLHDDGRVPADNPFVGQAGAAPEIWSYGHRNQQGAALHPQTGQLWTHEHGPQGGDEVNAIRAGANYGWPVITYGEEYGGGRVGDGLTARTGMEQPLLAWVPSIAPSGMTFYTGNRYPGWQGNLLVGALKFQLLVRLGMQDGKLVELERLLQGEIGRIRDVQQGPDGYVWLLNDEADGGLYRLETVQ